VPVFLQLRIERCPRDLRIFDGLFFRVLQRLERRRIAKFLQPLGEVVEVTVQMLLAINRFAFAMRKIQRNSCKSRFMVWDFDLAILRQIDVTGLLCLADDTQIFFLVAFGQ
jgi:hypothetical protein